MYIPERWESRQLGEWNLLVKGLMEAWDCAEALGLDECLRLHLNSDASGQLAELLSYMGRHEAGTLRLGSVPRRESDNQNNGHSHDDSEIEAYMQSTYSGKYPTEQAYAGAQLVRDFLLRVEQFAEEKRLATHDLRRILCEAMCVYSANEEIPFPLSS